jgi:cytochrome b6-f complex iron-sulfur subunit
MSTINRRQFVSGIAACACATCPALQALAAAPDGAAPVDVGPVDDFRGPGLHDPRGSGRRFFLVNNRGRLYAVSSTCTHKKVKLVASGDKLKCPRHGSGFDADGRVTKSPARKPLPRYAIRLSEEGTVVVDTSKTFGEKSWDEPESYLTLDNGPH